MQPPPYTRFPVLTADTIVLREITPMDCKDIVEISFYDGKPASTEQEALAMQQRIDADYQNGDSVHWGIVDKNTNIIVGTCGYYRGFAEKTGELGCVLRPAFQGKGYMTAALKLAIEFGIHQIKLEKIIAITSPQNSKAIQLLHRLQLEKIADLDPDTVKYKATNF